VVFPIFGLPELVYEKLYTVGRGSDEAEASEVAHLLSTFLVKATWGHSQLCAAWYLSAKGVAGKHTLGKVDFVV